MTSLREIEEEEPGDQEREDTPKRVSFESIIGQNVSSPPHRYFRKRSSATADSTGIQQSRFAGISGMLPSFPSFISRGTSRGGSSELSDDQPTRLASASEADAPTTIPSDAPRVYRRYRVGDTCLVSNHQSRFARLVNRYGYPPGEGFTPEEQRGPYVYVLATVTKVHFEEDAEYYTVMRADTGVYQRADDEWMEPLRTAQGEAAARRAATEAPKGSTNEQNLDQNRESGHSTHGPLYTVVTPFIWLFGWFYHIVVTRFYQWFENGKQVTQKNGRLFLNGMAPYSWSAKFTMVNFLVLCSMWYMFSDQLRLAFFPPSADWGLAISDL
jgi:hypothetical protein